MNAFVVISALFFGQIAHDAPVVWTEPEHHFLYLGEMREVDRSYAKLHYKDQGWKTVPIINGFAPARSERRVNGDIQVILDYRDRTPYSECITPERLAKKHVKKSKSVAETTKSKPEKVIPPFKLNLEKEERSENGLILPSDVSELPYRGPSYRSQ